MVALLALDAVVATVHLVTVLTREDVTASAAALLAAGAVVWASNVVVFSLLYWELDSGVRPPGPTEPRRHTLTSRFRNS